MSDIKELVKRIRRHFEGSRLWSVQSGLFHLGSSLGLEAADALEQQQAQLKILDYDIQEIYKPRIADLEAKVVELKDSVFQYGIENSKLQVSIDRLEASREAYSKKAVDRLHRAEAAEAKIKEMRDE